jgi:parallel beta-helix repeat protein
MTIQSFQINLAKPFPISAKPLHLGLATLLWWAGSSELLASHLGLLAQEPSSTQVAQVPLGGTVLYVNPAAGRDEAGAGNQAVPFRTATYALQQAQPGTVVKLERGSYTQQTGEVFPLSIPAGVTLVGEEETKGQTVALIGGGVFISPTFARQNATILAGNDTEIRGIAVTDPYVRGTGIWIESTNPRIKNCTFTNSHREGIFITGAGNPRIEKNVFSQNGGNGISTASNARGEIHDNLFQNTGFGLAIGGNSSPLVTDNQIIQNTDGIYINDSARPILRGNLIENNKRDGIVATIKAQPDLGNSESYGNNTIRNNKQYDLNNGTGGTLYSVGNRLDVSRVKGNVEFVASSSTDGQSAFRDVQGHWAQAYIKALAKRKIISGFPNGTFRPNDLVTRVQFAAIINKAFNPPARQSRIEFRDVASTFWGYQAVQSAVQGGFMKGYPEGTFKPEQPIPRVQALVSLSTGLGFGAGRANVLSMYQDAVQIPSWATGAVAAATERKIVVNYPTLSQLNPNRQASRAEVAAFVYQALVNAGKAEAIQSPYIVSRQ